MLLAPDTGMQSWYSALAKAVEGRQCGRVMACADFIFEFRCNNDRVEARRAVGVEVIALHQGAGQDLLDLADGRVAPGGDGVVLFLEAEEEDVEVFPGEFEFLRAVFLGDDGRHEVPYDAVVLHHRIEVDLLRDVRRRVRQMVD